MYVEAIVEYLRTRVQLPPPPFTFFNKINKLYVSGSKKNLAKTLPRIAYQNFTRIGLQVYA